MNARSDSPRSGAVLFLSMLIAVVPVPFSARSQARDAGALVEHVLAAHHSSVLDHATVTFELFGADFEITHDDGLFRYVREYVDDSNVRHRERIDNEGVFHWQEGAWARADEARARRIELNLNGGRYMVLLPHRIDDPQALHRHLGAETVAGEVYERLELIFEDAGHGSDDRFVLWIHRDSGVLGYRAVDFPSPRGDGTRIQQFAVARNPRRVENVLFHDWDQYQGAPEVGAAIEELAAAWEDGILEDAPDLEPRDIAVSAPVSLDAASRDYEARLAGTIDLWKERLTWEYEHQLEVAEGFEAIAAANPDRWEAWYWASHARTQLFGGPDRDRDLWRRDTSRAQEHLDRAAGVLPEDERSARERADFLVQQSLIHGHLGILTGDDAEKSRLQETADQEVAAALEIDPTNPRANMFRAMDRILEDAEEGRILLAEAAGLYDAYPPETAVGADWGRRWIDFWLAGQILNDDGRPGAGTIPYEAPEDTDAQMTAALEATIDDWKAALAASRSGDPAAAERTIEIAERHPDSWYAWYWAAHMTTQLSDTDGAGDLGERLDRAQGMLDRAGAALPPDRRTPREAADLHMMQALIWNLRGATAGDDPDAAARHRARYRQALEAAEAVDPRNPRAAAFRGFDLLREERLREGTLQLAEAIGKFEAYQPASTLHPDWGRRWVDFWLARRVQRFPSSASRQPAASAARHQPASAARRAPASAARQAPGSATEQPLDQHQVGLGLVQPRDQDVGPVR